MEVWSRPKLPFISIGTYILQTYHIISRNEQYTQTIIFLIIILYLFQCNHKIHVTSCNSWQPDWLNQWVAWLHNRIIIESWCYCCYATMTSFSQYDVIMLTWHFGCIYTYANNSFLKPILNQFSHMTTKSKLSFHPLLRYFGATVWKILDPLLKFKFSEKWKWFYWWKLFFQG